MRQIKISIRADHSGSLPAEFIQKEYLFTFLQVSAEKKIKLVNYFVSGTIYT